MQPLDFVILYVDAPERSAAFYADLLGIEPVERSPTFALFLLPSGMRLGLWSRHTVEPAAAPGVAGGCELTFRTDDPDALHGAWSARGLAILQPPTDMDFGRSFVALDPDGHHLRGYRMAEG